MKNHKLQKLQAAKIELFKSYMSMVIGSVGTKMFKHVYQKQGKKSVDILNIGDVSCGVQTSSILYLWGLINDTHATVKSTLADMQQNNWYKISKPKVGCVIEWEQKDPHFKHKHLGFYVGQNKAVSNDAKKGVPHIHHYTYGKINGKPKRKIIGLYWHPALDTGK